MLNAASLPDIPKRHPVIVINKLRREYLEKIEEYEGMLKELNTERPNDHKLVDDITSLRATLINRMKFCSDELLKLELT